MASASSGAVAEETISHERASAFSRTIGPKASWIRPEWTSFPVMTTPILASRTGFTRTIPPASRATAAASFTRVFAIVRGTARVPATTFSAGTYRSPAIVAHMTSPGRLKRYSASRATRRTPGHEALRLIFPSRGSPAGSTPGPWRASARICTASSS